MPAGGNKVMPAHFLLNTGRGGTRWTVCFCRLWNSWCNNGPGHSRSTATTADCFLSLSGPETLGHPLGQLTVHVHTITLCVFVCVLGGVGRKEAGSPLAWCPFFLLEYVMRRMHRSHWVVWNNATNSWTHWRHRNSTQRKQWVPVTSQRCTDIMKLCVEVTNISSVFFCKYKTNTAVKHILAWKDLWVYLTGAG